MTRSAENNPDNFFNLRFIKSYFKNILRDYVATTISVALIVITYKTLISRSYWDFIRIYLADLFVTFISLFTHSFQYFLSSFTLIVIGFFLIKNLQLKSWREKVQYNQSEQTTFYTSLLLKHGASISNKEDLLNFCQDTVDSLRDIFVQKSSSVNTTWLIPENDKLILFCTNKNSKYKNEGEHFSFRLGEGVVGKSWESGEVQFYSKKQENKHYRNRTQCGDVAYICHPIFNKPVNKYGMLSVGSDEDIYWSNEDKQTLNLISTVVVSILNNVDNEIKAELNL